jgi:hypothetical protein
MLLVTLWALVELCDGMQRDMVNKVAANEMLAVLGSLNDDSSQRFKDGLRY